jgi:hypothetical protein
MMEIQFNLKPAQLETHHFIAYRDRFPSLKRKRAQVSTCAHHLKEKDALSFAQFSAQNSDACQRGA